MTKQLIIFQGVPGSGKSTVAKQVAESTGGIIRSTDAMREVLINGAYVYIFDPDASARNHEINQALVAYDMIREVETIIVDNTNITQKWAQPYIDLAKRFGYSVQIVRVDPGVEEAVRRNALRREDRRVPEEVIRSWHSQMENLSVD